MTLDSRRKLLQGLVVSLPTAWSRPIVESVMLPAHATATACDAPEGCINVDEGSFRWPGGSIGIDIPAWETLSGCPSETATTSATIVLATSEAEALSLCGGPVFPLTNPNPAPTEGCRFWVCESDK